jgi:hypothetical protein
LNIDIFAKEAIMKIGFLGLAAAGVVATGLILLYTILVILAESTWGPLAEDPLNRFAAVGATGIMYPMLLWFTAACMQQAMRIKQTRRERSSEKDVPRIGLTYFLMGLVVWFGGTYFTTIDRTEIYGGVLVLMIGLILFTISGYILSKAIKV